MSLQPIDFQQLPLSTLLHDAKYKHEWATKKLWNYLFSKLIFFELKFVIGSEQPPVEYESQKRIDITIEVPSDDGEFFVVGICEKKKGKASPQDTVTVEDQAKKRSYEHCRHSRRTTNWAITVLGPKVRIWIYDYHGDHLQGILPSGAPRKRESYLDISDGHHRSQILQMFDYIKLNLNPPLADVARAYATGQDYQHGQSASYQYDQTASYGQGASSSVDTGYGQSQGATGNVMGSGNQAEAAQPAFQIEVKVLRSSKKHVYVYQRGDKNKKEIKLPSEGWWKDNREGQVKQWYWMMGIEGKDYYTADKLKLSK